jgi:hypothetical protein
VYAEQMDIAYEEDESDELEGDQGWARDAEHPS